MPVIIVSEKQTPGWKLLVDAVAQRKLGLAWVSLSDWRSGKVQKDPTTDLVITAAEDADKIEDEFSLIAVQRGCSSDQKVTHKKTFLIAGNNYDAFQGRNRLGKATDRIIYRGVDTDTFYPSERQFRREPTKPRLLHFGDLLSAGPLLEKLGFEVSEISDSNDVPDQMREGDIWLELSEKPHFLIEAIATNLVIVGANVGELWELSTGSIVRSKVELLEGWLNLKSGTLTFPDGIKANASAVADFVTLAWSHCKHLDSREYAKRWHSLEVFGQKWVEAIALAMQRFGLKEGGPRATTLPEEMHLMQAQPKPAASHTAPGHCRSCEGRRGGHRG